MNIKLAGLFAACLGVGPFAHAGGLVEPRSFSLVEGDIDKNGVRLKGESAETATFFNSLLSSAPGQQREKFHDFSKSAFGVGVESADGAQRRAELMRLYSLIKESPEGALTSSVSQDRLRGFYFYIIYRNSDEDFFTSLQAEEWDTRQLAYMASDLGLYCLKYRPGGVCFRPKLERKGVAVSP